MKTKMGRMLLLIACALLLAQVCFAQETDVEDLTIADVPPSAARLSWTGIDSVPCEYSVIYSIYRSSEDNFVPSPSNRIASGLARPTYLDKNTNSSKDYYYYVKAVEVPITCNLHSGQITVYPVDLGQTFALTVGDESSSCVAHSVAEINCAAPLPDFHVLIASQGKHEYLIGCESADYEGGNWTCVNLTLGVYRVLVHSQTLTVLNSGIVRGNLRTGKSIARIIPIFSVLAVLK